MKIIETAFAPKPLGHYHQAIVQNDIIYLAGQIGIDPKTSLLVNDDLSCEIKQVLTNIESVLQAAGSNKNKVLSMTVYVTETHFSKSVNDAFVTFFEDHKPARTTVTVRELPMDARIEMTAIAAA